MNKNKFLYIFLLIIFTNNISLASGITEAESYIKNLTNNIYKIVSNKDKELNEIRAELTSEIRKNLNVNWTSKFVLGETWQKISKEEQNEFTQIFEDYLIYNYAPKFQGYKGEEFQIIATKILAPSKFASSINVKLNSGTIVNIVIYFMEENNKFSFVDIAAEGISFAATQNMEFSAMISLSGFTKFIAELEGKVYELKKSSGLKTLEAVSPKQ